MLASLATAFGQEHRASADSSTTTKCGSNGKRKRSTILHSILVNAPGGNQWWENALYWRGFSFLPLYRARSDTPATFTTLKRTPGMSPTA